MLHNGIVRTHIRRYGMQEASYDSLVEKKQMWERRSSRVGYHKAHRPYNYPRPLGRSFKSGAESPHLCILIACLVAPAGRRAFATRNCLSFVPSTERKQKTDPITTATSTTPGYLHHDQVVNPPGFGIREAAIASFCRARLYAVTLPRTSFTLSQKTTTKAQPLPNIPIMEIMGK